MKYRFFHSLATLAFTAVLFTGCAGNKQAELAQTPPDTIQQNEPTPNPEDDPMLSVDTLHPAPPDFAIKRIDTDEYPVPQYARFLKGLRICLDPGHGGDAHKRAFKRGPTGVREAEMNLRIAQYLRDFLVHSGAEVLLTREEDIELSLKQRCEIANEWGADLFLSCHHNAIGKPNVNRCTVWFHLDVDYCPSGLDLARYLYVGLQDNLDLEQITGVPLKSDQLMYKEGFGVLRHCNMTRALCESSFFTNPEEEQRLRDPEYNLTEAYGLFLGMARYAAAGIPRATLQSPEDGTVSATDPGQLHFVLDDGLRARGAWGSERQMIMSDSISVQLDDQPLDFTFVNNGYKFTVDLPEEIEPGQHQLRLHYENMFKNSVINPWFTITAQE